MPFTAEHWRGPGKRDRDWWVAGSRAIQSRVFNLQRCAACRIEEEGRSRQVTSFRCSSISVQRRGLVDRPRRSSHQHRSSLLTSHPVGLSHAFGFRMPMMLKYKREEASLVTVAAESAGLSERTIGCRRKGACISRKRREAPNPHYLPGAGERSSDIATPFHPSGDGSPGAPDGGGRGGGPPVHRHARRQQGPWRPAGARVLRLRPTSRPVRGRAARSGREHVSRRRAERRLRLLGRFGRQLNVLLSFALFTLSLRACGTSSIPLLQCMC
jgi:hypothetical protein